MEKRFDQWIKVKETLHNKSNKIPFVNVGDLWWFSVGENVGREINGKSEVFTRPAIIYKKLMHGFFLVAPTSTQQNEGDWYVPIRYQDKHMRACLHHTRTIDYRRLWSKIGRLDQEEMKKVTQGFRDLYF